MIYSFPYLTAGRCGNIMRTRKLSTYASRILGFLCCNEAAVFLMLLILGSFFRSFLLGSFPFGLNQDEASAGYEAFSLLRSGMDRCGNPWPVLFVSWGSGQNVLYSYLTIPFVALFGLSEYSVRIVSALFGAAALPIFYFFARRAGGKRLAFLALFILAVNPWHIMISRWGLESNLLPFFLLLGIDLFERAQDKPVCLVWAAFAFGLSLYCYGTAFFFLFFFGIFCFIFLLRHPIKKKYILLSLLAFLITALPITATQLINVLNLPQLTVLGLTLPRLTETRQAVTTLFSSSAPLAQAADNLLGFCRILLTGSDGLLFNAVKPFGLFYLFGLPLSLLGFLVLVFRFSQRTINRQDVLMLSALAASFLSSLFISPNINRMNMAYLPILYLNAVGLDWIIGKYRPVAFLSFAVYWLSLFLFLSNYFTAYSAQLSQLFFQGLGSALEYAATIPADREYVTDKVNMPYIFVLFYDEIPPETFTSSATYENPNGAFRIVRSFGNYQFGWEEPDPSGVYVVYQSELAQFDARWTPVSFGQFSVLVPGRFNA